MKTTETRLIKEEI